MFHPTLLHDLPVGEVTEAAPAPPSSLLLHLSFEHTWRPLPAPAAGGGGPAGRSPRRGLAVGSWNSTFPTDRESPAEGSICRAACFFLGAKHVPKATVEETTPWWPWETPPRPMARSMDRRSHTRPLPVPPNLRGTPALPHSSVSQPCSSPEPRPGLSRETLLGLETQQTLRCNIHHAHGTASNLASS